MLTMVTTGPTGISGFADALAGYGFRAPEVLSVGEPATAGLGQQRPVLDLVVLPVSSPVFRAARLWGR